MSLGYNRNYREEMDDCLMPVAQRLSGCPVAAGAVGYTAKNRFVSHRLISHQFQIRAFLKCFDSIPFFQRTLIRSVPP